MRRYFTRVLALPLKATFTWKKRTSNKEAIPVEVTTFSPALREEGFATDSTVCIACSVKADVPSFSRHSLYRVDTERAGKLITFQNILPMRLLQLAVYLWMFIVINVVHLAEGSMTTEKNDFFFNRS